MMDSLHPDHRSLLSKDRSDLKTRAAHIFKTANFLSEELARRDLPEPSFQHGVHELIRNEAPESKARDARENLLQMLDEFRALLMEPSQTLVQPVDSANAIVRLGIAEAFPPQGATVQELASKLDLREDLVRRLLGHCATHHVFFHAAPDFFVHTAASRTLCERKDLQLWTKIRATETMPGTLKIGEALVKFPNSEEPAHSGWSLSERTDLPFFEALAKLPERASDFAKAMGTQTHLPGMPRQHLIANFPWSPTGDSLTVVDVGGGLGHISRAIVEHDPKVKCIVQDRPEVVQQGRTNLPESLQGRMTFEVHDFFKDQPVKGADVYFMRFILHDWPDKYATKIIQALVPALKPGAKIVVNDRVIPGIGEEHYLVEREARYADMRMLALQNAKERTADDWKLLFKEADPRFQITKISRPPKINLALIEVTWSG